MGDITPDDDPGCYREGVDQDSPKDIVDIDTAVTMLELAFGDLSAEKARCSMRVNTEFFKNGDAMAIRTNASTEHEFLNSVAITLDELIGARRFDGDWEFQLRRWLSQIVDITCKLRGYKAEVEEYRVLTAGDTMARDEDRIVVTRAEQGHEPSPAIVG